ncbi:hypothetical protein LSH36_449g01045, partial [Paralvinella palmiformis]
DDTYRSLEHKDSTVSTLSKKMEANRNIGQSIVNTGRNVMSTKMGVPVTRSTGSIGPSQLKHGTYRSLEHKDSTVSTLSKKMEANRNIGQSIVNTGRNVMSTKMGVPVTRSTGSIGPSQLKDGTYRSLEHKDSTVSTLSKKMEANRNIGQSVVNTGRNVMSTKMNSARCEFSFHEMENMKEKLSIPTTSVLKVCCLQMPRRRSSEEWPGRDSMSGQNLWLQGTVCDIKTDRNYGFIRPVDNLPRNFNKNKDVYFSFHAAVSCPEIEIGMEVRFLLDNNSKNKPKATTVHFGNTTDSDSSAEYSDVDVTECPDLYMDQEESSERYKNLLKIIQPMKSEMDDDLATMTSHKDFVTGVIKTLRDGFGSVKCSNDSSRADCDKLYVKFKIDYVTRAEFPLKIGDKLRFQLSSRHPASPTALSATLLECCERSMSELCNYLQYAQRLFVNDEEKSRSSRFLIELTSCSAIWRCLANAADMSDNYLESLMKFILETEKNAKDLHREDDSYIPHSGQFTTISSPEQLSTQILYTNM